MIGSMSVSSFTSDSDPSTASARLSSISAYTSAYTHVKWSDTQNNLLSINPTALNWTDSMTDQSATCEAIFKVC